MTRLRDVKRRLDRLDGGDDLAERREDIDLSLSTDEKEALNEAFDVEPATL